MLLGFQLEYLNIVCQIDCLKKICLSCTAFLIRYNSSALNCCTIFLSIVSDGQLWPMSWNRFLIFLLFSLYKGISGDKMSWLSFPHNRCFCSSKMFDKCVELVVQICFCVWTYFNDFQQESVSCKKPYSWTNMQYHWLLEFLINSSEKSWSIYGLNFRCFGSLNYWHHLKA